MALVVKTSPANAGDMRRGFSPWIGKIPWRRKWQLTPRELPGESHEERSLAGYSPEGRKELDTTERQGAHMPPVAVGWSQQPLRFYLCVLNPSVVFDCL